MQHHLFDFPISHVLVVNLAPAFVNLLFINDKRLKLSSLTKISLKQVFLFLMYEETWMQLVEGSRKKNRYVCQFIIY